MAIPYLAKTKPPKTNIVFFCPKCGDTIYAEVGFGSEIISEKCYNCDTTFNIKRNYADLIDIDIVTPTKAVKRARTTKTRKRY